MQECINNAAREAGEAALCRELRLDAMNDLSSALRKAEALSLMIYGDAGDSFRNLLDSYQDYFTWALSDLLSDAVNALARLEHLEAEGGAA